MTDWRNSTPPPPPEGFYKRSINPAPPPEDAPMADVIAHYKTNAPPTRPDAMFTTPQALLEAFEEYDKHYEANPILNDKAFSTRDGIRHTDIQSRRPRTINGFCKFLRITGRTWLDWKHDRTDLKEAIELIEEAIKADQLEGGLGGIYNPTIAARVLGLEERISNAHSLQDYKPPEIPSFASASSMVAHPDDPLDDNGNPTGPLYTPEQIEAGVPFAPLPVTIEGTRE